VTPKLCKAGIQLREQIDDSFPDRDRRSDGWLGDARHAARPSDHNPDEQNIVWATDTDKDLSGKAKPDFASDLADQLRLYANTLLISIAALARKTIRVLSLIFRY